MKFQSIVYCIVISFMIVLFSNVGMTPSMTPGGHTPGGMTPSGFTPGGSTPVGFTPSGTTPTGQKAMAMATPTPGNYSFIFQTTTLR